MNLLKLTDEEIVLIAFAIEDRLFPPDMEDESSSILRQIMIRFPELYERGMQLTV
jgi:hypothetical protein